ncbi:YkgJ family cysteine cluster protein [Carboxydothermus pertinax]|uniref:Zinc/iron-chelating domain-containing protein n=1 Tax=Carboxydothermus pertinax TaxID=870242 RepID=A0A1L8CXV5_9THEO|nr:YkgJ family cysteine cluster protein [Carboxydothermus pertinax]GAV23704.1 zinc/iron-chelating domain-containing protein [Carboxydothermus pertinax]
MEKVVIVPKIIENRQGYTIKVAPTATINDYLIEIEKLVEATEFYRESGTKTCLNCIKCCYERIPLTNIDVLNLQRSLFKKEGVSYDLLNFLRHFTDIFIKGLEIDIILKRKENGACIFLNEKEKKCDVYPVRPFVCRSFYCIPTTFNTELIRLGIVNLGEDALVRQYLLYLEESNTPPFWTLAKKPNLKISFYPENIFWNKKNYDIKIKKILEILK